jgi:hypothetical protein
MTKVDRLSHIIQVYLEGELELDTAVAELTHVYLVRGWRFSLIEAECAPRYRPRMRILVARIQSARQHTAASAPRGTLRGPA